MLKHIIFFRSVSGEHWIFWADFSIAWWEHHFAMPCESCHGCRLHVVGVDETRPGPQICPCEAWWWRPAFFDQHSSYMGRTSVSIDGLRRGDMSLKLSKVTFSDKGTYRCFVPGFDTDTSIKLVVGKPANIYLSSSAQFCSVCFYLIMRITDFSLPY